MQGRAFPGVRALTVALALVLGVGFLQPRIAAASPVVSLTKSICSYTYGGGCASTATVPGGTYVQYVITYTNGGTSGPLNITDVLSQPAAETYSPGSCTVPTGSGATCGDSGGSPDVVTFAFPNVPAGATGTVSFGVTISSGYSGSITNMAYAGYGASTYGSSNSTTLTVGGTGGYTGGYTGGGNGPLTVSKSVRDSSTGSSYGSTTYANPGDTLQYSITVTNGTTGTATSVVVYDTLQGYQTYRAGSCAPIYCNWDGQTVSFNVGALAPTQSATVTFMTNIVTSQVSNGTVIPNSAYVTSPPLPTSYSNTTAASIVNANTYTGSGQQCTSTASCTYPYCSGYYYPGYCPTSYPTCGPYGCYPGYPFCTSVAPSCSPSPYCNYIGCSGYPYCVTYTCAPVAPVAPVTPTVSITGQSTICGAVTSYVPPTGASAGQVTIDGESILLMPGVTVTGAVPLSTGGNYCLTFTTNTSGLVSSLVVTGNATGTQYVCGLVNPYQVGYYPWTGFGPYGYSPYPGYTSVPVSSTPYGPYPYGNYYYWNGPMVIGGYPYAVNSTTTFPYAISYGTQYCFLLNTAGSVTGSLSVYPTAAFPVETPSGHRLGHNIAY